MTKEHPLTEKLREVLDLDGPGTYTSEEFRKKVDRTVKRVDQELKHPQLWGATEVAKCLGVNHTNMYKIAELPEPAVVLTRGKLWSAYEIKELARRRRRK